MGNESRDSIGLATQIDRLCDEFELQLRSNSNPIIEDFIAPFPLAGRIELLKELIGLEVEYRRRKGEATLPSDYLRRFTELSESDISEILSKTISIGKPTPRSMTFDAASSGPASPWVDRSGQGRLLHYFGDYLLVDQIARGGMGTVYLATQVTLNRRVAVKMINSGQFASEMEVKRFYSEAKSAARLFHPNIIPVYEVGEVDGHHFYSMAYIDGQSLTQHLASGPIDPRDACRLLITIGLAVQFAHEHGVVHRDLKPSNIMLDQQGVPHVGDFGLAKSNIENTGITASGEILGTPSFMPPEQAEGDSQSTSFASDVYSLGAILYNCLSGRPPFQAASHVATLRQVIENEPVPLRQLNAAIPKDLETITHKCLSKAPSKRYSTARELVEDLNRLLEDRPILARPVGPVERGLRWCRRHPAQALNCTAAAVFVIGSLISWQVIHWQQRESAARHEASSLVGQLFVASDMELGSLVQKIRSSARAQKELAKRAAELDLNESSRYRAAIGLFQFDRSQIPLICNGWLQASWTEWYWLSEQLQSEKQSIARWLSSLSPEYVTALGDQQCLRLIAIDRFATDEAMSGKWPLEWQSKLAIDERLVASLLEELRTQPGQLISCEKALHGFRESLAPLMAARMDFRTSESHVDAVVAAQFLSHAFAGEPSRLFEIAWSARTEVLPLVFEKVSQSESNLSFYRQAIEADWEELPWSERIAAARRCALAGGLLFQAGQLEAILPRMHFSEKPTARCQLIEWLPVFRRDPALLIQFLDRMISQRSEHVREVIEKGANSHSDGNPWLKDENSAELRAVVLALGSYPTSIVENQLPRPVSSRLIDLFRNDPDPGVRSACEWYLRKTNRFLPETQTGNASDSPTDSNRSWRINTLGHVMVALQGPIEFVAGAELDDPGRDAGSPIDVFTGEVSHWSEDHPHRKRIPRSFEIAMHETTFAQMNQIDPDFHLLQNKDLAGSKDQPACKVRWIKAAEYCNKLSEREGISPDQWCFLPNKEGKYDLGMTLAPDYLQRTGYRLPTEAEWEFACRAGTRTGRYFGDSEELMESYAWYRNNSRERILSVPGTLRPNDFGLFDTLGNVKEWCMDRFDILYPGSRFISDDLPGKLEIGPGHILRGGGLYEIAQEIRASEYSQFEPSYRNGDTGFRLARTIVIPVNKTAP